MAFPSIDCCLICEGVRQEILGKHTILGLFGVSPHVRITVRDINGPLVLWFGFLGGTGTGKVRCALEFYDPKKSLIRNEFPDAANVEGVLDPQKPSISVFLGFKGDLKGPGKYGIRLLVDDQEKYSSTVEILPAEN